MKTLHALLIAISKYPNPRECLPGVAADLALMKTTLATFCQANAMRLDAKILADHDATRQGILDGYRFFLEAQPGDTCLVYYSGHGYQVRANKAFWLETDGMHEALYCHDAGLPGGRGVLDKELAHLGWKYVEAQNKGLHFVEIFDCCHAGGGTRALGDTAAAVRSREADRSIQLRESDYFGFGEYVKNGGGAVQPRVARRVNLSAAKSTETAKEAAIRGGERHGFFTASLSEVLRETNYQVSYAELLDRSYFKVQEFVRPLKERLGDQTPQMDEEQADTSALFGTGEPGGAKRSFTVGWDGERQRWLLRAGAAAGIPPTGETTLKIDGEFFKLGAVFPDVSEVALPERFDKSKTHRALIHSMKWDGKVKAAFALKMPKQAREIFSRALKAHFGGEQPLHFEMTGDPAAADLLVQVEKGDYFLVEKGSPVPLFKRARATDLPEFFGRAEQAAKWVSAQRLHNPNSSLRLGDLEIKLLHYPADAIEAAPQSADWRKPLECRMLGDEQPAAIELSVTNKGSRELWVSFAYLGADFSMTNRLLPGGKTSLAQGETAQMAFQDGDGNWVSKLFAVLPEALQNVGVTEAKEYLKVFASTKELDTSAYNQDALPVDEAYFKGGMKRALQTSAAKRSIEADEKNEWQAFTIRLDITKPALTGEIAAGQSSANILGHELKAPAGFQAKIGAAATREGQRAVGAGEPGALSHAIGIEPYYLSEGLATGSGLSTLKFTDAQGADSVTRESPLLLTLAQPVGKNEMVMSLGFDAETGLYFPVGFEQNGELHITALPEPMSDGQRSLGGSILLFLKKVVLETLKQEPKSVYTLALVTVRDDLEADPAYESNPAKIKAAVAAAKRILLCTHGIIGDTREMVKIVKRLKLQNPYDLVLAFDYENLDTEIKTIAGELKRELEEAGLKAGHGKTLHVVAHSMGGLASRWFIEQMDGGKVVTHLVMAGTPNGGSQWATVAQFATTGLTFAMNFLEVAKPVQMVLSFLGKYGDRALTSLRDMHPDSEFIKELNAAAVAPIPYSIVAGDIQAITADPKRLKLFGRLMLRFEKTVGSLLFKQSNDIACTVASILSSGGVPKFVEEVACDHLSYFENVRGLEALEKALNGAG